MITNQNTAWVTTHRDCLRCKETFLVGDVQRERDDLYAYYCADCLPWQISGKTGCSSCGKKQPRELFGKTKQGNRSRVCQGCKQHPMDRSHKCLKGNHRAPRKDFGTMQNGRASASCRMCSQARPLFHACRQCNKAFPREGFGSYPNGKRHEKCIDCRKQLAAYQTCRACKKTQLRELFPRNQSKKLSRFCVDCFEERRKNNPAIKEGLLPCLECGGTIRVSGRKDPNERKFCSRECAIKAFTLPERECTYCGAFKPTMQFARKKTGGGRKPTCMSCDEMRGSGRLPRKQGAATPKQLLLYVRRRAKSVGITEHVKMRHIYAVVQNDCAMCGADMACVGFRKNNCETVADTLVALCRYCQKMLAWRPYDELRAWAVAVAQGVTSQDPVPIRLRRKRKSTYIKKADREASSD